MWKGWSSNRVPTFERTERTRAWDWLTTLAALLGAVLVLRGGSEVAHGVRALSWPTARGTVRESRVQRDWAGRVYPRQGTNQLAHDVFVERRYGAYSFAVGDVVYQGRFRSDHPVATRESLAEGAAVGVHYDPSEPSRNTIDAWPRASTLFSVVLGAALLLFAGCSVTSFYWRGKRAPGRVAAA